MQRILILLACLAVGGCVIIPEPETPGNSPLSQQTIHGLPPSVWSCSLNREPECQ